MARTIHKVELSVKGIAEAIEYLENYKAIIEYNCELLIRKLADIGINVAMTTIAFEGEGDAERSADFDLQVEKDGLVIHGVLSITSTPNYTSDGRVFYPHLAWEFGAGNFYNEDGDINPLSEELSFPVGPGTFPEQTHVPDPGFWFYRENGHAMRSEGTQAVMPMYNASLEMRKKVFEVAKEVFR